MPDGMLGQEIGPEIGRCEFVGPVLPAESLLEDAPELKSPLPMTPPVVVAGHVNEVAQLVIVCVTNAVIITVLGRGQVL